MAKKNNIDHLIAYASALAPDTVENETFFELLKKARGDRSIEQYCSDAGITPVTYSRILHKKCKPSLMTLARLTSSAACPQNGITYDVLVDSAVIEGLVAEDSVKSFRSASESSGDSASPIFKNAAMAALQKKFIDEGSEIRILPENCLKVDDNVIKAHFHFIKRRSDAYLAFRHILSVLVLEAPDSRRVDYIFTNSSAFYEFAQSKKNQLRYRGNLVVAMINFDAESNEESRIIREDKISEY